ncbi:24331_t:CDS:2 [Cetraspora pellucida]|uniref:24331_t:CDS:1 n=1 Tax=Cetraspora pellucida TaxID=1433469 RepID=A0A9N9FUV7_9GLOM|nr:24331_t:CDS:2 [Cetraspora pellucida]
MTKDYILRTLDQKCKSWALAYLHKIFTAGIETTSRVEGYNWIIKQQLKANTTTLNTTYTVGQDLFLAITKVLDKYLTEPIKNMIREEMS